MYTIIVCATSCLSIAVDLRKNEDEEIQYVVINTMSFIIGGSAFVLSYTNELCQLDLYKDCQIIPVEIQVITQLGLTIFALIMNYKVFKNTQLKSKIL